jgi:hypothetical protein
LARLAAIAGGKPFRFAGPPGRLSVGDAGRADGLAAAGMAAAGAGPSVLAVGRGVATFDSIKGGNGGIGVGDVMVAIAGAGNISAMELRRGC